MGDFGVSKKKKFGDERRISYLLSLFVTILLIMCLCRSTPYSLVLPALCLARLSKSTVFSFSIYLR